MPGEQATKQAAQATAAPTAKPWERRADENDLWYERFIAYLKLGPGRSVSLVSTGKRNSYPIPSHWMIVAKRNEWRERAAAYDAAHGLADGTEQPVD